MKAMRISIAAAAAVAVSLGLISLTGSVNAAAAPTTKGTLRPAIHLAHKAGMSPQGIPIQYSGNWSGYVATPKKGGAKSFRYVAASYEVPSVNCSVTNYAFSYHWVGLDGWTDGTVEQDGIGSFCNGSTPDYFAWAWMYPSPGEVKQIAVNAGDSITSTVSYASGVYTLKLTDHTTGKHFDVTSAGTDSNASAEAITEGYPSPPTENGTADFGTEHYHSVKVTSSSGAVGGLTGSGWSTDEFVSYGASGDVDTQPGPLTTTSGGSSFKVTWLHEN